MCTEPLATGTTARGAEHLARSARGRVGLAAALIGLALVTLPPGAGAQSKPAAPGTQTATGTPGAPGNDGSSSAAGKAPLLFPAPGPGAASPGGAASPSGGAEPAPAAPDAPGLGSGQGFHSPQSAFAPLRDLPGVLPWRLFGEVTHRQEGKRAVPVFPAQLTGLAGTRVKVQGFMLPLQAGERQKHFLLSAVPTSCNFCLPAGPEGVIEVRIRGTGIKVDIDAIVLEGTLQVLPSDPMGLLYRLTDARAAR